MGNYVRATGLIEVEGIETHSEPEPPSVPIPESDGEVDLTGYVPLLAFLQKHKEKLIDLLTIKQERKIPRYVVAGSTTAKSLLIPIILDRLCKDFSSEKNVSQKDMLTVALVEFLIKYGFETEIEHMLNSGRV